MGEYSPAKTGEYPRIFPNFQNCARCVKDLKDNKDNSLHLGRKYARIFVLGHYLFLVAHSFTRATLSENCSLLGTDNVRGQISEHIFAPNGGYCLYRNKVIIIIIETLSITLDFFMARLFTWQSIPATVCDLRSGGVVTLITVYVVNCAKYNKAVALMDWNFA